ncbi:MAG: hypothetical protein AUG48_02145 [Actinobacteria bacterium 13_1_20CM_3_68_9]|nr:MAG: hypothetical protein AUG48_02145 [Actinobacteria bacterium 13_1_20CM_3_68_9]
MASDSGSGNGAARRLARRDPGLAVRMTRSLLAERRRVRRQGGERLPLRRLLAPGGPESWLVTAGGSTPISRCGRSSI